MQVRPIITLTTDFGLSDHYVGTMKGVILSRCPEAVIVDICHNVATFSILGGAYILDQSAPYFPPRTFHVVVIDPGVGTSRRAIAAEALGQMFIAPDNGVLSMVLRRDPSAVVRALTNAEMFLASVSSTFHGRDVFASSAAALAAGSFALPTAGPVISDFEVLNNLEPVPSEAGVWHGIVLSVDQFGNVITNFPTSQFARESVRIQAGDDEIVKSHKTFGEGSPAELFIYAGSSGLLEIGMNRSSAAHRLGLQPGSRLELTKLK